jgi:hypothetical protein
MNTSQDSLRGLEDFHEHGHMGTIDEGVRDIGIDATDGDMHMHMPPRDMRAPRVSVGRSVGKMLLRSDRGVEQSLQRLVSTLTDQIREKAAAIERLENSKRRGAYVYVCVCERISFGTGHWPTQRIAQRHKHKDTLHDLIHIPTQTPRAHSP